MRNKDRYIWLASGLFAFAILIAVAFVPTVLAQPDTTSTEEYLRTFEEVFHYIEENYVEEIDPQVLFEGAMKGMFDTLDDPLTNDNAFLPGSALIPAALAYM